MLTILTHHNSNRLEYVLDFCFRNRGIGVEVKASENNDPDVVTLANESGVTVELPVSSLLFEIGLKQYEIKCEDASSDEVLSFNGVKDVFGSIFYVLTCYEEWLPYTSDMHGRFKVVDSVLFKYNLLEKAICDRWTNLIYEQLELEYQSTFQLVPTFDIDNTYAYKHKVGSRRTLSIIRDVVRREKTRIKERKRVEAGEKDPYDTFDLIKSIISSNSRSKVFWLVAPLGKNDRNLPIDLKEHKELIKDLDVQNHIGLHPGYSTMDSIENLREQKHNLEQILDRPVESSRQHFLKFNIPTTYRILLNSGIKHEYSMGYADLAGFRAGTARPFPWYDIENEIATDLTIHPFVYMDGTLNEYMHLTIEEAIQKVSDLWSEVKMYGGDYIFIWHNETIGDYGKWKNWNLVLKATMDLT